MHALETERLVIRGLSDGDVDAFVRIMDACFGPSAEPCGYRERLRFYALAETVLADLRGWDSVAIAGVLLAVESRFGIDVDRDRLENLVTAKDLADLAELGSRR